MHSTKRNLTFSEKKTVKLWGAVRKNIISDRFSTKSALSLRIFSYLCEEVSLHAFGYICA